VPRQAPPAATEAPPDAGGEGAGDVDAAPVPVAAATRHKAPLRRRLALAVATVVAILGAGTAAFAGTKAHALRAGADPANRALVDQAATQSVVTQISRAVQTVYSYDYHELGRDHRAGKRVVTGPFAATYEKRFAGVQKKASKYKLTLAALVDDAGVRSLRDGKATVLVFVNQHATAGGGQQRVSRAAGLLVHARKVHGTWKIARVAKT
jgi:Mce-associated membrane protein